MKRIKIIVPIPMDAEGVADRASHLPKHLVRPEFDVEFVPVKTARRSATATTTRC